MDKEKLKKYAEVIVKVGINLKEKDGVFITANTESLPLLREVVRACWRGGAKDVITKLTDDDFTLAKFEEGRDYAFDYCPEFKLNYADAMLKDNYHLISIGAPSLDLLKNVSQEKQQRAEVADVKLWEVQDKYIDAGRVKWIGVSCPTASWAKTIFPNVSEEEAVNALWEKIFEACRINEDDPVKAWEVHDGNLKVLEKWLDDQKFEYLKYEGPGTNLTVYLAENHKWVGGSSVTFDGVKYIANIPTEEIFTAPHAMKVNGTLKATKPLTRWGKVVKDFRLVFEDGKVVEFAAEENQEILEKIMDMDEGSHYLGEVAIVPNSSPISRMGMLFRSTLFDENASCHFALGSSYAETILYGEKMSVEERKALGANDSMIHIDFMVGGPELSITGYKKDGTAVPVLKNGEWAIEL